MIGYSQIIILYLLVLHSEINILYKIKSMLLFIAY